MASASDDGTIPRPRGPRALSAITEGVNELRGRPERVRYVAALLACGEWDYYGAALVLALAGEWGLKQATVREYAQEVRATLALNPRTLGEIKALLARELDSIRKKAVKAEAFGPAVQAVMGKAKVFGVVAGGADAKQGPPAPETPPWLRKAGPKP